MTSGQSIKPAPGVLLIAAADLPDLNFSRTVVLICDHRDEGSFGLVLNQHLPVMLSEVIDDLRGWDAPLFRGGPVQENTLHFVHRCPDAGIGGAEILPGLFWGGDFDAVNDALGRGAANVDNLRFFAGYSGWGAGQLAGEIERDSWYLNQATDEIVFCADARNQWRLAVQHLGQDFRLFSNFPDDPRLN